MTKFQKFIQNLPHGQYGDFRAAVKLELLKAGIGISDQTFRNWENGVYEPDTAEKRGIINGVALALAGARIFDE